MGYCSFCRDANLGSEERFAGAVIGNADAIAGDDQVGRRDLAGPRRRAGTAPDDLGPLSIVNVCRNVEPPPDPPVIISAIGVTDSTVPLITSFCLPAPALVSTGARIRRTLAAISLPPRSRYTTSIASPTLISSENFGPDFPAAAAARVAVPAPSP